jgi:DNA polymerase III epsilon subunit-like protein
MGHGLTQDVLESEGVPIEVALDGFLAFMDEAKVVASYGITFDTKMLRGELRRLGKPDLFGTKPEFCLMREATRQCKAAGEKLPGRRNVKLVRACEVLLGRVHDRPHRAMPDAEVAADLYQHFAHMGCLEPKVRESIQKPAA